MPNPLTMLASPPQSMYIFYPTPKPPLSDNDIKEGDHSEESQNRSAEKLKAEFQDTIHNKVPNIEEEVPMEIELTPPKLKQAYSTTALSVKPELLKLERSSTVKYKDPNDDRPIHPSRWIKVFSSGLDVIHEKAKIERDDKKEFLKKKKV